VSDVLAKIDETLTYYSAGLGEEITVEREADGDWFADFLDRTFAAWNGHTTNPPPLLLAPPSYASVVNAMVELERHATNFALVVSADLAPAFRAVRLAFDRPLRPKVARRQRRADLRRVHRDYVQRKRKGPRGYSHLVGYAAFPTRFVFGIDPTHDTEAR
jgi:hypothetical protein